MPRGMFPSAELVADRFLGHKSVLTTERYLGVKFEETREAILLLDGPLTQALSRSVNGNIASQLLEASPDISLGPVN